MAGSFECGDEPLRSIKGGEFLEWLWNCQVLIKDCASWS